MSSSPSLRLAWLLIPMALASAACTDNVTCVFAGTCEGGVGTGGISDNPALRPFDGDWIVDGPPRVEAFFPSGTTNPSTTPLVLVFSESIQQATLANAIEIAPLIDGLAGSPVLGVAQSLVSDGRVLVLLPTSPLVAGDYLVRLGEEALVTDLTGQVLDVAPGAQLGIFSVSVMPAAAPGLVMTFPANAVRNQSETTQIVAVFDRPVLPQSVDGASFDVRVNGSDPAFDPPAEAIRVGTPSTADTRAFLYRSVDANGLSAALGTDVDVELRLSPAGDSIQEPGGGILPPQTITFHTLLFASARSASLMSSPDDAIGLANLTSGSGNELLIQVELDGNGLEQNDSIDLFLVGEKRGPLPQPLIALQRALRLDAPALSATFTLADVGLLLSDSPTDVRFNDGPLSFAFRTRRNTIVAPLRILDLEPDPDVIQDPLLDTTRPNLGNLTGSTGTSAFRSDLRGLALSGRADERLTMVAVAAPAGPVLTPMAVVGANDDGLFLAPPVGPEVVVGGEQTYSLVGLDTALNSSDPAVTGTHTQLGVLDGAAHDPGDPIDVEVFDSRTLLPIQGALVLVHADLGNGLDFPFERSQTTDGDGRFLGLATDAMVASTPVASTIVTVVAVGFDLFTLHGVPAAHLSVPLQRSNLGLARAAGQVLTTNPGAMAFLEGFDRRYDDSRRAVEQPRGFVGFGCSSAQGTLSCPYGPETIRDARLGVRSMYAGNFRHVDETEEQMFAASQVLKAFALLVPLDAVASGGLQQGILEIDRLLDDPAAPPENAAQDLAAFTFLVDAGSGIVLPLAGDPDPSTTGAPFVTVEVLVPGVAGAIAVSQGLAFDQGSGDRWTVRSAQPGATTASGPLGSAGVVETEPYVRVEVVDGDLNGNAVGVRPRLSSILAAGPSPDLRVFRALAAPVEISPAAAASTGGQAFSLLLTHAIGDDRSEGGLYRVRLRDETGRGWTLWRFDPPGTDPVELRVVDVGDAGAVGLADGQVVSLPTAWAWSGLSPTDFLWTDVERRFELFSRAADLSFQKP